MLQNLVVYDIYVMKFSKKNVTKLLDPNFRKQVLASVPSKWISETKAKAYSYYVTDSQIISRSKELADNKDACYGFSPLNTLCAVRKDGVVETQLMEFNIVNHFLAKNDGDSAAEVVLCMLVLWLSQDKLKTIRDFDIDTIDAALHKLETEFIEANKKEAEAKEQKDAEDKNCN